MRAYLLDEALATVLAVDAKRQEALGKGKAVLPRGQRYSQEADYDDAADMATLARALPETARATRADAVGNQDTTDDHVAALLAQVG